ncbi:hypothetical protein WMY93_014819 [Mugilogobius chulae]|uniref:Type I cytokine receptor cytokine-binding domain-containing protein n=1 Tax=Mugilogobius chulae TaxID=88201 RepID=A0AAW0P293_9GOBI
MTGHLHYVGFLLCCSLTSVSSIKVFPPQNVTLGWTDGLYQQLFWTPPKHSEANCSYQVNSTIRGGKEYPSTKTQTSPPWDEYRVMNGGFVNISIQTVCDGTKSDPVIVTVDDPDLHLSCLILSSSLTRCSWKPPSSAVDIRFFYNLEDPNSDDSIPTPPLQECPLYTNGTTCDLQMKPTQELKVLLNGTANTRTIRNIYQFSSLQLRLRPLNWTIRESKEQFHISWTAPEFDLDWKYIIKYIVCNETLKKEVPSGLSAELDRMPDCSYQISVRAVTVNGVTEWTTFRRFDAVPSSNFMPLAVVLIPLSMALLVILFLMWCMKNKRKMFPKVPQPNPELFKDILNNNNKVYIPDFYSPSMEEECHVTLVVDPKLVKT